MRPCHTVRIEGPTDDMCEVHRLHCALEDAMNLFAVEVKTGNLLIMLSGKATHYPVLFMGIGYVNQSMQRLVPESHCRIHDVMFFH